MTNRQNLLPQAPNVRILLGLAGGILGLLLCLICGIAVVPGAPTTPTTEVAQQATPTGTLLPTDTPTATATPTIPQPPNCPQTTPEPLWVDPVTSPTDQLSQVITVRIGNGEFVRITSEAGTFTVSGSFNAYNTPAQIRINLVPNAANHLEVTAQVRTIVQGNCTYGGYSLTTRNDRTGNPLTILQRPLVSTPTVTRVPTFTPTATKPRITLAGAHPNGIALDPDHNLIWVAGRDTSMVYAIDENSLQVIARVPVGKQPFGVAYTNRLSNGMVYVANFGSDSLSAVDATTRQVTTIPFKIGGEPTFPVIDPNRGRIGRLFVPLHDVGVLAAVELANSSVNRWSTLSVSPSPTAAGGGPYGLASLVPGQNRLFLGRRDSNDLVVVDTVEPVVSSITRLDGSPYYVAASLNPIVGFAGNIYRIYVTMAPAARPDQPDRLALLNASFNTDLGVFNNPSMVRIRTVITGPQGDAGGFVAVYPHVGSNWDDTVWVSANKQVQVWDLDLNRLLRVFGPADGVGNNPYGIAIDARIRRVFVTDGDADTVLAINLP